MYCYVSVCLQVNVTGIFIFHFAYDWRVNVTGIFYISVCLQLFLQSYFYVSPSLHGCLL